MASAEGCVAWLGWALAIVLLLIVATWKGWL
jgi:hypothetical protein